MNVVETKNLEKIYSDADLEVRAVDGVSFDVKEGEFTAIVGPSGSGKTTLLNIIGGLDAPNQGSVKVASKELTGMSKSELIDFRLQNIGFVFQSYNLIPVLTAYENIEFVMLLQNRSFKERKERVEELLEAVGIAEKSNKRPSQLSGGQQQRVAVARAIVGEPAIVLADEPTANLDSKTSQALVELLRQLNETHNITIICATHDKLVKEYGRRIVNMLDGQIVSEETH